MKTIGRQDVSVVAMRKGIPCMLLASAAADQGPPTAGLGSEPLLLVFFPSGPGTVSGSPARSTGKDIHCSAGVSLSLIEPCQHQAGCRGKQAKLHFPTTCVRTGI